MSGQGRSNWVGEYYSVLEQQLIIYLYCYGLAYRKPERNTRKIGASNAANN